MLGRQGHQATGIFGAESVPVLPVTHFAQLVVIQTGTAQLPVIQGESQGTDQVQAGPGIGTKANDVPGIRRNFGFIQRNVYQNGLTTTRITITTRYRTGTSFIQR